MGVKITDIIDLFEQFWFVDKHLPSVIPKQLKMQTMNWDYRHEFSDIVHNKKWKDKPKQRITLLRHNFDDYSTCLDLGLTLPVEDRKLLYLRPNYSYRKLGHLYGVSHETIRNRYLGIVVDLVNKINKAGCDTIKSYLILTNQSKTY